MDFFEIQAFYELSKTLHFAKAASRVHLSPSALSRLVMRLEEEVGVSLLNRDTRQVQLTDEGKDFLRFAQDVLAQKEDLLFEFQEQKESLRGSLRIYASVTACYTILPDFIEAISQNFPDIKLLIDTGDPALSQTKLNNDDCDIAVSALPSENDSSRFMLSQFDSYAVKTSPLVFIAKNESPFALFTKETIYEKASFILPKQGLARARFDEKVKQKAHPIIAAETSGNEAVLALSALGLGVGLVPQIVLQQGPFSQGLMEYPQDFCRLGSYSIGFLIKKDLRQTHSSFRILTAIRPILESLSEKT